MICNHIWGNQFYKSFMTCLWSLVKGGFTSLPLILMLVTEAINTELVACVTQRFKINFNCSIIALSVVLVSVVQQRESIIWIHMSPLLWISFPFRSP